MGTRSSRAASSGGDGARICTGAAEGTGVGTAAARSIAANMSPLVTCPRRPLPATVDGSRPLSAASLRTEGGAGMSRGIGCSGPAPIGLMREVFWSGAPVGLAAGPTTTAGLAELAPDSLIWPSSAPTATVAPSCAATSESTPLAGAGTSSVTLSVSSSTRGSSTATVSPGRLNHLPTVASVTDSPREGTRISVITFCPSPWPVAATHAFPPRALHHDVEPGTRPGLTECGNLSQRLVEQLSQLFQMLRQQSGRRGRRRRAPGVAGLAVLGADLIQHPLQEHVDEKPRAHVARLFLAPDHFSVPESRQLRYQRLGRERIELLNAQDIDVIETAFLAFLVKIIVHLARAQDHAAYSLVGHKLDLFRGQNLRIIPQQTMERRAVGHLVEPRDGALVAQQALRRHQNQGLPDFAFYLPAQDVKVVGRRRAIGNLHVVFRTHLQEAFEPRRGMLGPLTLVTVRQQADEARHAQPFAFPGRDELVEDDLRAVCEVAELRLP